MAALTAVRVDEEIKQRYIGLMARNGSKRQSLVAIARLLIRRCFGVLKSGKAYDFSIPQNASPKPSKLTKVTRSTTSQESKKLKVARGVTLVG